MGPEVKPSDGILNVDKPYGATSMEVVRRVKRAGGFKRVGHGGTLDPIATGVLPICIGQATRVMEYLVGGTKDYRAVVELGVETDTYDALGRVTASKDPTYLTHSDVQRAMKTFMGVTLQVPPMFSALKMQGKRLYELARAGIEVEREPRQVETYRVDLVEWACPLATVEVSCGRGFYMRSLAHDLGVALGCGASLKSLVRLRSGPFQVSDAIPLSSLEQMLADGTWQQAMYPPDSVLYDLPGAIVGRRLLDMITHGQPLPASLGKPVRQTGVRCRTYGTSGQFVGVLAFDPSIGQWRPEKIFSLSDQGGDPTPPKVAAASRIAIDRSVV